MPEPLALLSEGELGHVSGMAGSSEQALMRGPVADRVRAGLNGIDYLFRAILVIALVVQLVIVLTRIVSRFWFDQSILWADEAAKLFLSMTAFIGGALAFRARHHTTVEFLTGKLPPRWRASFAAGIDLLILITAALVGYISLDLVSISATSNTPMLQINAAWLVVPLTIGLALTTLFAIERLASVYAPRDIAPAACVVALLAGFVYTVSVMPSLHPGNGTALGLMLIAFLLAILLGLPVSFAMLLGSLSFLLITGIAPLIAVAVGDCIGGGAEIVAGADLRVGGDNLRLAWAGGRLGVPIGPGRLGLLAGTAVAKDLVLTGRAIGMAEAERLGLLQRTAPAAEAESIAIEVAEQIAKQHPAGTRVLKQMFRELDRTAQRTAYENELLLRFQEHGAGIPRSR